MYDTQNNYQDSTDSAQELASSPESLDTANNGDQQDNLLTEDGSSSLNSDLTSTLESESEDGTQELSPEALDTATTDVSEQEDALLAEGDSALETEGDSQELSPESLDTATTDGSEQEDALLAEGDSALEAEGDSQELSPEASDTATTDGGEQEDALLAEGDSALEAEDDSQELSPEASETATTNGGEQEDPLLAEGDSCSSSTLESEDGSQELASSPESLDTATTSSSEQEDPLLAEGDSALETEGDSQELSPEASDTATTEGGEQEDALLAEGDSALEAEDDSQELASSPDALDTATTDGGEQENALLAEGDSSLLSSDQFQDLENTGLFTSNSNGGIPTENPNIPANVEDGSDLEKLDFSAEYACPNGTGDDLLTGTSGANVFEFNALLNATPEIYQQYADAEGRIDWEGVTGENNNYHDHWLDSLGEDTIDDFSGSGGDGDTIDISGHTVAITVLEESDNQVRLGLYADQDADGARGNGAHDFDVLGTLTVNHDGNFNLGSDVTVNPEVTDGAFEFA